MIVVLDSNILGMLSTPDESASLEREGELKEVRHCTEWLYKLLAKGARVIIPDICDYEVRRELIRIGSSSVKELNSLRELLDCYEVTFEVLAEAAELWAESRKISQPNKLEENIDVDCIIAACCHVLERDNPGQAVILATKNIKDFQRTTNCAHWQDIRYP